MGKFLYFAYGSNLLHERLQERCPSAHPQGMAVAKGFELKFWKLSKDNSGKATLVRNREKQQYGVLFEINLEEMTLLDKAEGKGNGYERRDDFIVEASKDGSNLTVSTYIAERLDQNLKPFDWYLATVIAGAEQNGLPREMIQSLRTTNFDTDSQHDRESRKIAVAALNKYGIRDLNQFLASGT